MQDRRRRSQRAATSQSATSRDRCAPVVVVCRRPSAGRHAGNISAPRENEEILYLLHIKVGHPLLSALHVCALDLSAFEGEATPPLQLYLLYVWLSVRLLICLCIRMRGGRGGGVCMCVCVGKVRPPRGRNLIWYCVNIGARTRARKGC